MKIRKPQSYRQILQVDNDDKKGGVVVGLRAKGPAKKDCSGFVVKTSQLVQISAMVAA